jgi:hypothetical protein
MDSSIGSQVGVVLANLRTAVEIAKSLLGLKDASKAKEKIGEILTDLVAAQERVLAVQQDLSKLVAENDELKKENLSLKAWETEKRNYTLRQIAVGVFAYVYTPTEGAAHEDHAVCCRCYDDGKRSILQRQHQLSSPTIECTRCGMKIHLPPPRMEQARVVR